MSAATLNMRMGWSTCFSNDMQALKKHLLQQVAPGIWKPQQVLPSGASPEGCLQRLSQEICE